MNIERRKEWVGCLVFSGGFVEVFYEILSFNFIGGYRSY